MEARAALEQVEELRRVLEEWQRAPEDSQEQIWAAHYDRAMGVLAMLFQ